MGFGKDGKGQILWDALNQGLGALAAKDVVAFGARAIQEDFRILRLDYYAAWKAAAAGDAVLFGLADGALTAAEIEECIENQALDSNDVPAIEQSMRPVWPMDMLVDSAGGTPNVSGSIKPRWTFKDTDSWQYWAYNPDSSTALTTGGELPLVCKIFGVWVT